jgi:hypothetical protein
MATQTRAAAAKKGVRIPPIKEQMKELTSLVDDDTGKKVLTPAKVKRAIKKAVVIEKEENAVKRLAIPECAGDVAKIQKKERKQRDPAKVRVKVGGADEGYCVKCKTSRVIQNPKPESITNKAGRVMHAIKGTCPTCQGKMTRFTGATAKKD